MSTELLTRRVKRLEDKSASNSLRLDLLEGGHPYRGRPPSIDLARKMVLASIPPDSLEEDMGEPSPSGTHIDKFPVAQLQRLIAENAAAKALAREKWVISKAGSVLVAVVTILVVGFLGLLYGSLHEQSNRQPPPLSAPAH
jgi:hypothetical protein